MWWREALYQTWSGSNCEHLYSTKFFLPNCIWLIFDCRFGLLDACPQARIVTREWQVALRPESWNDAQKIGGRITFREGFTETTQRTVCNPSGLLDWKFPCNPWRET